LIGGWLRILRPFPPSAAELEKPIVTAGRRTGVLTITKLLPPLDAELQYRIKSEGEAALVEISARRRSDLGRIRGSQERMLLLALVSPRTHLIALGARLRSQFIDGQPRRSIDRWRLFGLSALPLRRDGGHPCVLPPQGNWFTPFLISPASVSVHLA
jgi:hypothetical protein